MKKIMFSFLSLLIIVLSAGCVNIEVPKERISIVATMFPEYDLARAIAGDVADVQMLLKPGQEAHQFEPTPENIRKICNCDVFIYGGGESDTWLDEILKSVNTDSISIISLMDIVDLLEEEESEGMDVRGETESDEIEYDEHVWTSPVNALAIAAEITKVLCTKDSKNTSYYLKSFEELRSELIALDKEFRTISETVEEKTLIFADRFPLLYFAKEYGFNYYAAFPGCSANTEPSAKTIAFLIDTVKEKNLTAIFKIELSNDNIAFAVSEATGAKIYTFYTCHNVSKQDFENGETYVSLMKKNIQILKEALSLCH